jgi:hypothetical protein
MVGDPVFLSLFLLVFGFIWWIFSLLMAFMSGWQKFAEQHPIPDGLEAPIKVFNYCSVQFNTMGSYTNSVKISLYAEGFVLEPLWLFSSFHQPLFVRWDKVRDISQEKEFWSIPALDVYVGDTKIRLYKRAMKAVSAFVAIEANRER